MATIPLNDNRIKKLIADVERALISGDGKPKLSEADGKGLTLRREKSGSWAWVYRYYRPDGRRNNLPLGVYPTVTLATARIKHREAMELLAQGIDPAIDRKETQLKQAITIQNTFEAAARAWWDSWRMANSEDYTLKILAMLEKDVFSIMGNYPVQSVKPSLIRLVVKTIVDRGALDTAKKAFYYIRTILSYAVSHELVDYNIAREMSVNDLIPKRKAQSQSRVQIEDLPQLLRDIDAYNGHLVTKYAIQLMALTFVRTKELIEAPWAEFDLKRRLWVIHEDRMKMRKAHAVPLSTQSMAILSKLKEITGGGVYLFPSIKGDGKTMSNNTILYALYRMGYHSRMTGHGFRGVASTELREQGYSVDLVELQLSHLVGSEVERAYNKMELLNKRTEMMQAWADYLDKQRYEGVALKVVK